MKVAYNNNEAKKLYQAVNIIRKGFRPQTFLFIDTRTHAHTHFYGSSIHSVMF